MTETLIVNGVVIANGVADSDGDVLTKKDIKTIFMKYQNDTDTMHTNIKNDGVEVFSNWISEIDTVIGGKTAPAGSWLVTMKVTNPNLIQCLENGKLNGFSLGSVSEKAMTPKYWFINKSLNYRDIKDIEEVIPLYISFVDNPANQYGFEIMSYDNYINKNEKDVKEMTEIETKDEMISISALERVKDLFGINKSETVVVEKAEEEPVAEATMEETTADETVTALFEKLDTIIEQNKEILAGLQKSEEEESVDEEEEIEKAEEEKSEEEETETANDDEEIEKAETDEETSEEEKKEEEEVKVEKRQTNMIENQNTQSYTTFYQKTGRDSLGRKIRK